MKLTHTTVVTLAVLTLFVGAGVAQPAGGTADKPDASGGLPSDLPDPVPDFVGGILDSIGQFLDGALDGSLGSAVSDQASNGTDTGSGR